MDEEFYMHRGSLGILCGPDFLEKLADDNLKSLAILRKLLKKNRTAVAFLIMKELRGSRIWELYENICGRNMDRFIYHILMELPHQGSGELNLISSEYSEEIGFTEKSSLNHFKARQQGNPNSFWALEDHPTEKDYEYPIIILNINLEIS